MLFENDECLEKHPFVAGKLEAIQLTDHCLNIFMHVSLNLTVASILTEKRAESGQAWQCLCSLRAPCDT